MMQRVELDWPSSAIAASISFGPGSKDSRFVKAIRAGAIRLASRVVPTGGATVDRMPRIGAAALVGELWGEAPAGRTRLDEAMPPALVLGVPDATSAARLELHAASRSSEQPAQSGPEASSSSLP